MGILRRHFLETLAAIPLLKTNYTQKEITKRAIHGYPEKLLDGFEEYGQIRNIEIHHSYSISHTEQMACGIIVSFKHIHLEFSTEPPERSIRNAFDGLTVSGIRIVPYKLYLLGIQTC